jgi:hypothetical protein
MDKKTNNYKYSLHNTQGYGNFGVAEVTPMISLSPLGGG